MGLSITDAMRALVGRPFDEFTSEPISFGDVARWEQAAMWPDLVPARDATDDEVPRELNPFAWQHGDHPRPQPGTPDSYIEGAAGGVGPGATRSVNGELHARYGVSMRIGDRINTASRIVDYRLRESSQGPILLTDIETTWSNQDGAIVRVLLNTVVRW
jgi:hypothetical protein